MNEMYNSAQNPQAANGTDWTLMGSTCDLVGPETETYMIGGHKSIFLHPFCYDHSGYIHDTNDSSDATIVWCDGTACNIEGGFITDWTPWSSAPHSLLHMMYALWLSNW